MNSVSNYYFWREVSKCKAEGRGEKVGGGCQHLVGYSMPKIQDSKFEHCKILKFTKIEIQKGLKDYVKWKEITKCSNNSVETIPSKGAN